MNPDNVTIWSNGGKKRSEIVDLILITIYSTFFSLAHKTSSRKVITTSRSIIRIYTCIYMPMWNFLNRGSYLLLSIIYFAVDKMKQKEKISNLRFREAKITKIKQRIWCNTAIMIHDFLAFVSNYVLIFL